MNSTIRLNQISFNMSVEAIIHRSNIPLKFSDCTFENYIPNSGYPSQIYIILRAYVSNSIF